MEIQEAEKVCPLPVRKIMSLLTRADKYTRKQALAGSPGREMTGNQLIKMRLPEYQTNIQPGVLSEHRPERYLHSTKAQWTGLVRAEIVEQTGQPTPEIIQAHLQGMHLHQEILLAAAEEEDKNVNYLRLSL